MSGGHDEDLHLETEGDGFLASAEDDAFDAAPTPVIDLPPLPASCLSPPGAPTPSFAELQSPRDLPSYKRIRDSRILVDAFRHRSPDFVYLLSHFHSDHYQGISERWDTGPIYCSETTGRLLCHVLGVKPEYIRPIPLDTSVWIDGVELRAMNANHCPGAICVLFRGFAPRELEAPKKGAAAANGAAAVGSLKRGREHLRQAWAVFHCGDFRFDPERTPAWPGWWENWSAQRAPDGDVPIRISIDELFLDNTYANPKHLFPRQEVPMGIIADLIAQRLASEAPRRTLFLIATYTIGKEKVLDAVFARTGLRMLVSKRKWAVLSLLELSDIMGRVEGAEKDVDAKPPLSRWFTLDAPETPIHVLPWSLLGQSAPGGWTFLADWRYFAQSLVFENTRIEKSGRDVPLYTDVMAFVPTGWTWELSKKSGDKGYAVQEKTTAEGSRFELVQVPYSEHSSFSELRDFVRFVKPTRIVPTVIWSKDPAEASRKAEKVKGLFGDLVDAKRDKQESFAKLFGGAARQRPLASSAEKTVPDDVERTAIKSDATTGRDGVIALDSDDETPSATPSASASAVCPLCDRSFPNAEIEQHASGCRGRSATASPASGKKPVGASQKAKTGKASATQASITKFFSK
ncbi:beta-lactamase-like protein [Hyaloraphidium curvatum]|nr:beta-lactamase-like protein [Hyaloraphidium curvatum]